MIDQATYDALVVGDHARPHRLLDSAAVDARMQALDEAERPYAEAASAYAAAGDAATARRHLAGAARQIPEGDLRDAYVLRVARADVAIAERRWDDAIREARLAHVGRCNDCGQLRLALAYDGRGAAGDRDSAIAAFERTRVNLQPRTTERPVLRRLGELYEAKGDRPDAIDRYARFGALWKRADPELQPQVAEARKRIAALQGREGRTR